METLTSVVPVHSHLLRLQLTTSSVVGGHLREVRAIAMAAATIGGLEFLDRQYIDQPSGQTFMDCRC